MHKARSENIPEQFIPRHSHKHLLKKTLLSTKFQWLMKYVDNENLEPGLKLAQHIEAKPHPQPRRPLQERTNHCLGRETTHSQEMQKVRLPSSLLNRNSLNRESNSTELERIFVNKSKVRNKSLALNSFRSRKSNLLREEERYRKRAISKLKTEPIYDRTKSKERYLERIEKEINISPWGLPHDTSTNDFISFCQ